MHTHFDTPVITAVLILLYTQIAASLVNEEAKFLHTSLVLQNMLAICSMTIFAKHEYDSTWVLFLVFIVFHLQMVFLFLLARGGFEGTGHVVSLFTRMNDSRQPWRI